MRGLSLAKNVEKESTYMVADPEDDRYQYLGCVAT